MPEEPFLPIALPPGLYKNGTQYQAKGRWTDASLVRFFDGTIRPVGGYRHLLDDAGAEYSPLAGCPRGAYAYRGDDLKTNIAVGTTEKLYVLQDGTLLDITPTGTFTTGACYGVTTGGRTYGSGDYGAGTYGGFSSVSNPIPGDTWSLDNFGNDLVACLTSDGEVLLWDGAASEASVAANSPTNVRAVVVTPERFLFALGGVDVVAGGNPNPRLVQWPSQESTDEWTPGVTTTAGGFPITTAGFLLAGRKTRRQTLLWTDVDVWTATYIGGTFLYQFDQVGTDCGLLAPNAMAVVGDKAFWMGRQNFFVFDGYTVPLPCEVADFVFSGINLTNRAQIHCQTLSEFHEIWWFYPSAGSVANDRYVVFNHVENHWTVGALARETGVDRGVAPAPILVDDQGQLWEHEFGFDHQGATPYIESGPFEMGNGDKVYRVQRVIPDEKTQGDLSLQIRTAMYPTDTPVLSSSISLNSAAPIDVRFTARQMQFRFDEANEVDWRLGTFRVGARAQGRR